MNHGNLKNKKVAISISESPDLEALGFGRVHLEDAMVEIGRYLLASEMKLVFGGDLRIKNNFTRTLFDLAKDQYNQTPKRVFSNYFAWPIHLNLTDEERADHYDSAKMIRLKPTDTELDPEVFLPPNTPQNVAVWARSLTYMRRTQTGDVDARIMLGGQMDEFKGAWPGLVEEAWLTLQANKPLFILGAFGGCAQLVIDMIQGELSADDIRAQVGSKMRGAYSAMINHFNSEAEQRGVNPIKYEKLSTFFKTKTIKDLNNGLCENENLVLFQETEIHRIIALIMKGLTRCLGK